MFAQIVFFINVLFVDIWKFTYVAAGYKFAGGPATPDEQSLNIIVRITQAMVGCLLFCVGQVVYAHYRKMRLQRAEANKVANQFKKIKKVTWKDN